MNYPNNNKIDHRNVHIDWLSFYLWRKIRSHYIPRTTTNNKKHLKNEFMIFRLTFTELVLNKHKQMTGRVSARGERGANACHHLHRPCQTEEREYCSMFKKNSSRSSSSKFGYTVPTSGLSTNKYSSLVHCLSNIMLN